MGGGNTLARASHPNFSPKGAALAVFSFSPPRGSAAHGQSGSHAHTTECSLCQWLPWGQWEGTSSSWESGRPSQPSWAHLFCQPGPLLRKSLPRSSAPGGTLSGFQVCCTGLVGHRMGHLTGTTGAPKLDRASLPGLLLGLFCLCSPHTHPLGTAQPFSSPQWPCIYFQPRSPLPPVLHQE